MNEDCLFFGCWTTKGHDLYSTSGESLAFTKTAENLPFKWTKLDTGFIAEDCKWKDGHFIAEDCKWKDGHATLTNLDGYTILAFSDRSIDTRPASNSAYLMKGTFDFNEAVEIAKRNFPKIWARYKFDVVDKTPK